MRSPGSDCESKLPGVNWKLTMQPYNKSADCQHSKFSGNPDLFKFSVEILKNPAPPPEKSLRAAGFSPQNDLRPEWLYSAVNCCLRVLPGENGPRGYASAMRPVNSLRRAVNRGIKRDGR